VACERLCVPPEAGRGALGVTLNEHKLRREIVGEMHLRRWPPITPPMTVVQILRLVPAGTTIDGLPSFRVGDAPFSAAGQRHMDGTLGDGATFTWERHSEATTLTVFASPMHPCWPRRAPGRKARRAKCCAPR